MKKLLFAVLLTSSAHACYWGDHKYPFNFSVNEDSKVVMIGHRESIIGYATKYENAMVVKYSMPGNIVITIDQYKKTTEVCYNGYCYPCQ